ncbi:Stage 0 sporulation protein KA [Candidatus Rubidus massiliensis]|nr:Stage 0 sporulation protein KA [Candidatus Rubidus massiliensis]
MKRFVISLCYCLIASSFFLSCHKDTKKQVNHLKIAISEEPTTLDPRFATDLASMTTIKMLYEGLIRLNCFGKPQYAIAEKIEISPDQKTYTIHLKESKWSDDSPLTAQDFEETWFSVLDSKNLAPNAYQLFMIRGAKDFHLNKVSKNEVGIKASDSKTLVVEIEKPIPYFITLLSSPFFLPVHKTLRQTEEIEGTNVPSNGPFTLKDWKKHNELSLTKNYNYVENKQVVFTDIELDVLDENIAYQMFLSNDLDWAGSPMSTLPQDSLQALKHRNLIRYLQAAGTHWLRFNTNDPIFSNKYFRQALSYAINRKDIVDHVTQGHQTPALAIVPPLMGLTSKGYFQDSDNPKAWEAFQLALKELKIDNDQIPELVLSYGASEREHKIAQVLQQQWQKIFSIPIRLEKVESKSYLAKVKSGNYQIAIGSWFADFMDPMNFLEIFKSKANSSNRTSWENETYTTILNQSDEEADETKRKELLVQAEKILMDEMPVAPLFFSTFNFLKSENGQHVSLIPLGYFNFNCNELTYDSIP